MFKVGREFRVEAPAFKSEDAIMVAPGFDLNGLYLSAASPIPDNTLRFLQSNGVQVQIMTEDGDKLLRISGSFDLHRNTVVEFLGRPHRPSDLPMEGKPVTLSVFHPNDLTIELPCVLYGLNLLAEEDIPLDLVEFFQSRGGRIEVIREEQPTRNCVKFSGTFKVTSTEIGEFIKKRAAAKKDAEKKESDDDVRTTAFVKEIIVSKTQFTSDTIRLVTEYAGFGYGYRVVEASNFQQQVQARLLMSQKLNFEFRGQPLGLGYIFHIKGNPVTSILPQKYFSTKDDISIQSEQDAINLDGVVLHSSQDIQVTGKKHSSVKGHDLRSLNDVGYLSDLTAARDVKIRCEGGIELSNAFSLVGRNFEVISEDDAVILRRDPKKTWINGPAIPSLVFSHSQPLLSQAANAKSSSDPSTINKPLSNDIKDKKENSKEEEQANSLTILLKKFQIKKDKDLPTPELAFRRAAAMGNVDVMDKLLTTVKGLDINAPGSESGKTALDLAQAQGDNKAIQFLIERGAKSGSEIPKQSILTAFSAVSSSASSSSLTSTLQMNVSPH